MYCTHTHTHTHTHSHSHSRLTLRNHVSALLTIASTSVGEASVLIVVVEVILVIGNWKY